MTPLAWFVLGFVAFPGSLTVIIALGYLAARWYLGPKQKPDIRLAAAAPDLYDARAGLIEEKERLR